MNSPFSIGTLKLPNRLIQGPLAGYSCAPFRQLMHAFTPPAYAVSEMISAHDVLHKHAPTSRYLYRAPEETILAYQLSGRDPRILAEAAIKLEALGANLIDLNCGCPKPKMRKKGVGSALLETPLHLMTLIEALRGAIRIPLTVKIRIQDHDTDITLARQIEQAGADALIVHGRRWTDDYNVACDLHQIGRIKRALSIPVIANGDIADSTSLEHAFVTSGCDAYMIGRAGCGNPWLYETLLTGNALPTRTTRIQTFVTHIKGLAVLEDEYKAMLQSKSLVRYYFRHELDEHALAQFFLLTQMDLMASFLSHHLASPIGQIDSLE